MHLVKEKGEQLDCFLFLFLVLSRKKSKIYSPWNSSASLHILRSQEQGNGKDCGEEREEVAYLYELYLICIGYTALPLNACHRVLLTV